VSKAADCGSGVEEPRRALSSVLSALCFRVSGQDASFGRLRQISC
jgi:hypothetical protein